MRIKDLTLKKVGVFEQMYINFRKEEKPQNAEIHLFTGPNGSGKSTILQALAAGFNGTYFDGGSRVQTLVSGLETNQTGYLNSRECLSIANPIFQKLHTLGRDQYLRYRSCTEISFNNGSFVQCRGCEICNKIHIDSHSTLVDEYRSQLNLATLPAYEFQFAVFCYSGYRAISYQNNNNITNEEVNPLQNSLEFIKPIDGNFTIRNLLITALLKRSYALQENDQETTQHYNHLIAGVEQAISAIVGYKLNFVLDLQPIKVLFKTDEGRFDFDVLPDGLKSLISWIADVAMRLDMLQWKDNTPVFERSIILMLDEIEVHLHPAWQRKVLPTVQKMFPNAQIFVTTHSPFVINSVNDAYLYRLQPNSTQTTLVAEKTSTERSYITEIIETLGVKEEFGEETQNLFDEFMSLKRAIIHNETVDKAHFREITNTLMHNQDSPMHDIVQLELNRLLRTAPAKAEYVHD